MTTKSQSLELTIRNAKGVTKRQPDGSKRADNFLPVFLVMPLCVNRIFPLLINSGHYK